MILFGVYSNIEKEINPYELTLEHNLNYKKQIVLGLLHFLNRIVLSGLPYQVWVISKCSYSSTLWFSSVPGWCFSSPIILFSTLSAVPCPVPLGLSDLNFFDVYWIIWNHIITTGFLTGCIWLVCIAKKF